VKDLEKEKAKEESLLKDVSKEKEKIVKEEQQVKSSLSQGKSQLEIKEHDI
jgi:hypothetical protein